jgi:thiamine-monophosphate kinase
LNDPYLYTYVKLSGLGERTIIQQITQLLSRGNTPVWIGDDCAALDNGKDYLLITTDMISEHTHIPPGMTPYQIGWFITAINLSDIAAKGGSPLGLVFSMGLPPATTDSYLHDLIQGAETCVQRYNTHIIGGDTKEAPVLTLTGTAIGRVPKQEFMPRTGAQPGDIIAVTGTLGDAGTGLYALHHHIDAPGLIKRLLEPTPRLPEGQILAHTKSVTTCMDISDGLSASLYQLHSLNTNVGFTIDQHKLPISPALEQLHTQHSKDITEWMVHSGGDYELLLTLPKNRFKAVAAALTITGTPFTEIGYVTSEPKLSLIINGTHHILKNRGYEHFTRSHHPK